MNNYPITDYTKEKAKEYNVFVKKSDKRFYKLDVFDSNGYYITSIGDFRYKDFPTYAKEEGIEKALVKRYLYHLRHSKDISKKGSRGWWASVLLW